MQTLAGSIIRIMALRTTRVAMAARITADQTREVTADRMVVRTAEVTGDQTEVAGRTGAEAATDHAFGTSGS